MWIINDEKSGRTGAEFGKRYTMNLGTIALYHFLSPNFVLHKDLKKVSKSYVVDCFLTAFSGTLAGTTHEAMFTKGKSFGAKMRCDTCLDSGIVSPMSVFCTACNRICCSNHIGLHNSVFCHLMDTNSLGRAWYTNLEQRLFASKSRPADLTKLFMAIPNGSKIITQSVTCDAQDDLINNLEKELQKISHFTFGVAYANQKYMDLCKKNVVVSAIDESKCVETKSDIPSDEKRRMAFMWFAKWITAANEMERAKRVQQAQKFIEGEPSLKEIS